MLYDRLDELREQAAHRLTAELRNTGGTLQDRSQRDSSVAMYADQVEQFSAVENGLCFGRLDGDDDSRRYIGRIGIFDDQRRLRPAADGLAGARRPAVLPRHRRQPAGRPPAPAPAHPAAQGRPASTTRCSTSTPPHPAGHEELTGEAALLAALNAGRTGRMSDIVETIQAEQDRIIRAELPRRPGGPGRPRHRQDRRRAAPGGVPALHPPRELLPAAGVLIVGPNPTFLRYIGQVLPSLGETGVLLRTHGRPVSRASSAQRDRAGRDRGAQGPGGDGRGARRRPCATGSAVPDEPLEIDGRAGDADASTRRPCAPPGTGPGAAGRPHNLARRALRRGDRARARRPGRRADRRRPARRRQPARRGGPRRDPPRAARGAGGPGRPATGCGRCSPRSGCSPTCSPTRTGSPPPRRCSAEDERALLRPRAAAAGRPPTCRCSTRPPSCSARTSGPPPPGGTASG